MSNATKTSTPANPSSGFAPSLVRRPGNGDGSGVRGRRSMRRSASVVVSSSQLSRRRSVGARRSAGTSATRDAGDSASSHVRDAGRTLSERASGSATALKNARVRLGVTRGSSRLEHGDQRAGATSISRFPMRAHVSSAGNWNTVSSWPGILVDPSNVTRRFITRTGDAMTTGSKISSFEWGIMDGARPRLTAPLAPASTEARI